MILCLFHLPHDANPTSFSYYIEKGHYFFGWIPDDIIYNHLKFSCRKSIIIGLTKKFVWGRTQYYCSCYLLNIYSWICTSWICTYDIMSLRYFHLKTRNIGQVRLSNLPKVTARYWKKWVYNSGLLLLYQVVFLLDGSWLITSSYGNWLTARVCLVTCIK